MLGENGHGQFRPQTKPMAGANGHGIRDPNHHNRHLNLVKSSDVERFQKAVHSHALIAPKAGSAIIAKAASFFHRHSHSGNKKKRKGRHLRKGHEGQEPHDDHGHGHGCGHKVKQLTIFDDEATDNCFASALQENVVSDECYEAAFETVVVYNQLVNENKLYEQEQQFFTAFAMLFFFAFVLLPLTMLLARCCVSRSGRCRKMKEMFALRARILYTVYRDPEIRSRVEKQMGGELGDVVPLHCVESNEDVVTEIIEGRVEAEPHGKRQSFCGSYCRSLGIFFMTFFILCMPLPVLLNMISFMLVVYVGVKAVRCMCRCMCGSGKGKKESEYAAVGGYPAHTGAGGDEDADVEMNSAEKSAAIFVGVPVRL